MNLSRKQADGSQDDKAAPPGGQSGGAKLFLFLAVVVAMIHVFALTEVSDDDAVVVIFSGALNVALCLGLASVLSSLFELRREFEALRRAVERRQDEADEADEG